MASAAGSLFARTYAGHTGVDPYTTAVSDVYQDLFGEGIFTGKGLYDVDAFAAALDGRVPENALLSHDLFEGLYARTALVTDIEVVDDYPSSVLAHARRQHRWVRGDWQILWWLFPFVPSRTGLERNRLPLIARWKILDNLRRSLLPPATLLLLVLGWTVLPGRPVVWTAIALATRRCSHAWRPCSSLLAVRADGSRGAASAHGSRRSEDGRGARRTAARFMANEACERLHAIGVTLVRLGVTRRRLLEWETTAASAARGGPLRLRAFIGGMMASPLLALAILVAVAALRPAGAAGRRADPRPVGRRALDRVRAQPADAADAARRRRRRIAPTCTRSRGRPGRTSRRSSAPRTTSCRPTTFRSAPELTIAHRTSPTNIGLGLLATLAAHDLDFIDTPSSFADRRDAHDDRAARAIRRPPVQLVRHADAGAAAAGLRLDGGQRQPRRRAPDAVGRPPRHRTRIWRRAPTRSSTR